MDRLFSGRRSADSSRPAEPGGQIGIILVPAAQVERPSTPHRIRAIAATLADAGVPKYRVVVSGTADGKALSDEFPLVQPADLARVCANQLAVFVPSDQYHVSHEWIADLVSRTRATGFSHTHENYNSPIVGNLSLRCVFLVAHPSVVDGVAELLTHGTEVHGLKPVFAQRELPLEEVAITATNVASLYRQAALMDVPISYVLESNSSCNYHCLMCPYHGGRQKSKPTFLKPGTYVDMPFETFTRVVDEIANLPHPYQDDPPITISPYRRGEFLLYPQWREALSYIKTKPGIKAYFSSNGSLWTDEDIEFVLDVGLDHVQISIEGHDTESHKKIRLNSEFEKVASTIRRIMTRREARGLSKPYLQLAHTVNEKNFGLVDEYVKFWLHKVDALFLGPENYADEGTNNKRYKTQFSPVEPRPKQDRPPCQMVKDNIWIDAEGTVILCIGSKQTMIGNVHEMSMAEILKSPVRLEVLKQHYTGEYAAGLCSNCEQWYSAYGQTIDSEEHSAFMSPDTQYYRGKGPLETTW
jgi:MoaA/NifB/PqqE/SkfB family radical SAM enzyme